MLLNFPPPSNWQDFQILTMRHVEQLCLAGTVRVYGRGGQRQDGVDVYGELLDGRHLGVQCKQIMRGSLKRKTIEDEAKLARAFLPKLDLFIVATTLSEDTVLHKAVTGINQARTFPFKVSYWSWAHFNDVLNRSNQLVKESYKRYADAFDVDERKQDLCALHEAFHRPAFLDDFKYELSADDFILALSDTILFLQSGSLRDRLTNSLLRGTYPLNMLPSGENKQLRERLLRDVAAMRSLALKDFKHGQLGPSSAGIYNARRRAMITTLNVSLEECGISPIILTY